MKLGEYIEKKLEKSEKKWRIECAVDNTNLSAALDCRWSSRGHNAEEATVTCCCSTKNKVLTHSHLMGKQENSSKKRDYVGTSKGMEGEGVARICKKLKEENYELIRVSHDNDASTMAQIKDVFPTCIEELDVGHAANNICKKVKEMGREHKVLVGFGEKVKRRFQDLAYKAKGM
jgi:hypothetical protein